MPAARFRASQSHIAAAITSLSQPGRGWLVHWRAAACDATHLAKLVLPAREDGERRDDEVGAARRPARGRRRHAVRLERGQKGDGLQRLAQAHVCRGMVGWRVEVRGCGALGGSAGQHGPRRAWSGSQRVSGTTLSALIRTFFTVSRLVPFRTELNPFWCLHSARAQCSGSQAAFFRPLPRTVAEDGAMAAAIARAEKVDARDLCRRSGTTRVRVRVSEALGSL